MASKTKSETGNLKLEELLKKAGFSKVRKINDRVIHATVADDKAFGKAHAAVLQSACNCPEFHGCSRLPMATSNDVLVVHVQAVTEEAAETAAVPEEPIQPKA